MFCLKKSRKDIIALVKEGEYELISRKTTQKKGRPTKKSIGQKSEVNKGDQNMSSKDVNQQKAENPNRDITKELEPRLDKALDWYRVLLEEHKNAEANKDAKSPYNDCKGNTEETENSTSQTIKKDSFDETKLLSSKEVAEAMARCVKLPQDQQEELLTELETSMDLSDFSLESEWTVDITEEAHKWFRKHIKRQYNFCERVIRRLKLLSTGRWPYVLCKPLKTKTSAIKLYEAKIDTGGRIIWEVAISFSPRRSSADHTYSEQYVDCCLGLNVQFKYMF